MSEPIDDLQLLCEQAAALARSMPTPVQRISVRRGDCEVEVEWPTRHEVPQVNTTVERQLTE